MVVVVEGMGYVGLVSSQHSAGGMGMAGEGQRRPMEVGVTKFVCFASLWDGRFGKLAPGCFPKCHYESLNQFRVLSGPGCVSYGGVRLIL